VIKAWDDGVASMKKGEVARLICRSDYGYGKTGSPPKIPADATLVFEVELFEWKGMFVIGYLLLFAYVKMLQKLQRDHYSVTCSNALWCISCSVTSLILSQMVMLHVLL